MRSLPYLNRSTPEQLMNPFTDDSQIEELMEFGFYDDEETKHQIEEFYDDLAVGLPLDSTHDF